MAYDCFIKFTGGPDEVKGECTDSTHKGTDGWIQLMSFSLGATNVAHVGSDKTGSGAGKANFSDYSITKALDNASPQLFKVMCSGDHFAKVNVEMRKAGGKTPLVFLKYDFETVFITSYQVSGSNGQTPFESITFAYTKIVKTYTTQGSGGANGKTNPVSYDRSANVVPGK